MMHNFLSFLTEAKTKKEKAFNLNDAKGKLYEILSGSHLIHGTHKSGKPNQFLSHYRDEEGKTPEDVHNYIKSKLDELHPGMYQQINQHAAEAAEHMRNTLAADGHHTIHEGAWTSQSGDHKRFTKVDDPNSDADVMVRTNKGHIGISMKYGSNKDMNLRNNGLEALEKMAKLKNNELTKARSKHQKNLEELGIESHDQYKKMRDEGTPKEKQTAAAADESALAAQREMAKHLTHGLATNLNSEELRQYVKDRISPKTKFQHYRMHTRTNDSGGASHHMNDIQDDASKLDHFEHFRVVPHTGGISVKIEGRRIGSTKYEPILDQAIKKGNGPTKGFASTTKAPFASKAFDKNKPSTATSPPSREVAPPVKKKPVQSFSQHVVKPMNKPKKTGYGVAGDNPDSPMHNWASGEVAGSKFKSKSEM